MLTGYIDFEDAHALDLFSGTGSITLELLSRGCSQVVSVELDRDHHRFIQQCIEKLLLTPHASILRADAFRYIKSCKRQFDFIFADPPYALKELSTIPGLIFEHGLLKDDGVLVFEHGKDHDFSDDPHFVEHRSYGSVNFDFQNNGDNSRVTLSHRRVINPARMRSGRSVSATDCRSSSRNSCFILCATPSS